jgi:molecular chaperone GrpE (heat shock protein)
MLKRLVVLGLVLLFAGAAVLGRVLAEKRKQEAQVARYRSKYDAELSEDLKQYDKWLQLPPEERSALPLSLDGYETTGKKTQRQQEQHERLTADLDKLAGGEMDTPPLADFLYGNNWREKLSEYKKRKERNEFVLTASIVCTSIGGTTFASCMFYYIVRFIIIALYCLRKFVAAHLSSPAVSEHEGLVEVESVKDPEDSRVSPTQQAHCSDTSQAQQPCTQQTGLKRRARAVAGSTSQNSNNDCKIRLEQNTAQSASVSVQQVIAEHSDTLNGTLTELTQQVAAIREYASDQQDRVKKLQEGYDWNIIRNFCLRVIRCIDNLESRISQQSARSSHTAHLTEVRDELLFALESSGIERFEPEIGSHYRGQEKCAEAVKDREQCDDPDKTGKIANVIRPGYRYLIGEEDVKIVRPAVVKLFG